MHRVHPLVVSGVLAVAAHPAPRTQPASEWLGRWAGESACAGAHPACRAEHVVYRIDAAGAGALSVRGARVAGSDTVDMGDLACRVGAGRAAGRAEATCRVSVGVWRFWITHDRLEGSLTLADTTVARHVVARRLTSHRR
jgi:hypothetical protein